MIQRHNEIRDLEAELVEMICSDVQIKPSLQPVTGETLDRGANKENGTRLDVHATGGLWERQRSAVYDVRVCHPNADSYREMTPQQIYKQHETEKKRQYSSRVMEIEHGTFTPLVLTTTGGMADECRRYHCRLNLYRPRKESLTQQYSPILFAQQGLHNRRNLFLKGWPPIC